MTPPLLSVGSLSKSFGGVHACVNVSLSLAAGEAVGLIGQNGAGKTTLLNCIAGFYWVDGGSIVLDGERVERDPPERRSHRGVGRTFQNLRPFLGMTVLENVMVGALCNTRNVREARELADDAIGYVALETKRNTPARALSTGQRKRLELARALASKPRLLLLDEVTGGVDPAALPEIIKLVERVRTDGMSMLIIEHNMGALQHMADRFIAMHLGRVIATGSPTEVLRDPIVVETYLGEAYVE